MPGSDAHFNQIPLTDQASSGHCSSNPSKLASLERQVCRCAARVCLATNVCCCNNYCPASLLQEGAGVFGLALRKSLAEC